MDESIIIFTAICYESYNNVATGPCRRFRTVFTFEYSRHTAARRHCLWSHSTVLTRENILHGFRWIPWRIFRVEYWNELPWTISSFSTADRRIIFLDIVHGVFPWIPWNVSMECGFGPCFPWTVSTDKMSSFFHGVHGKLSVWSIETLFHGKFPCFPLQASFPFMDNVHG